MTIPTNLQRYADQCEAERVKARIQRDVLDYMEFDTEEDYFETAAELMKLQASVF